MWQLTLHPLLLLLMQGAVAFQISPEQPQAGEPLTLTIRRSFDADCQWRVTPRVEADLRLVQVTLDVDGEPFCDDVLTDRTFELALGALPLGDHLLAVSWSDTGLVGLAPVRVEGGE